MNVADSLVNADKLNKRKQEFDGDLCCPVCGVTLQNLLLLNRHLDRDHKFDEGSEHALSGTHQGSTDNERDVSHAARKPKFELKRSHWSKIVNGKSRCQTCDAKLDKKVGAINCRRCGSLFCRRHCQLVIKLNHNAEYDAINGEWCKCCSKCYKERSGYNDFGAIVDKSDIFKAERARRNEDKQLRQLQLENRFIRLTSGLALIHSQYNGSMLGLWRLSAETTKIERSIVPWTPDEAAFACYLCSNTFGLALRRHHCRLCGRAVCSGGETNCSNEIPISNLINAASDLPIEASKIPTEGLTAQTRLCSACVRTIFWKRKFTKEMLQPMSPVLQINNKMHSTATNILSILPQFKAAAQAQADGLADMPNASDVQFLIKTRRRLLDSFSVYDKLTKQVLHIEPRNSAEGRIQKAIVSRASKFIEENMLPLKALTATSTPQSSSLEPSPEAKGLVSRISNNSLSIKEVKDYRTQLMVLEEQKFLVENMIANATKQRKFDEANILKTNLAELISQAKDITDLLGEEGFK